MDNEYFLILLFMVFRIADGITSYIPAKGLIPGVGEANPLTLLAIERWGFVWAFLLLTAASLGFLLAFVIATHLEEARLAGKTDYRGMLRIRRFRIAGLACLAALSSFPLFINLSVAISIA